MGMRFRKSVKICKGVKVNFSKSGTSLSLGGRGHSVNFGSKGTRVTAGIPGTGLSYSTKVGGSNRGKSSSSRTSDRAPSTQGNVGASAECTVCNSETRPKKRKTWLWVLGWLFVFPLPLTVLLVRNKNMNKKGKIAILAVAWILYLIIVGCGNSSSTTDAGTTMHNNSAVSERGSEPIVKTSIKGLSFSSTKDVTVKVDQTVSSGYVKANVKVGKDFLPEEVVFVSENPKVATIALKNVALTTYLYYEITGVGAGETNVYAMSRDGTVVSEYIKVTVPTPVGVDSIDIQNAKTELVIGEKTESKATINPANADAKTLTWTSTDESVAVVDSKGTVAAVGGGNATITATAPNGVSTSFDVIVDGTKTLMNLRVSYPRQDDNNIGNEWSYYTEINGERPTRTIGIAPGDKLSFYAEFTESDNNPDIGKASASYTVTEEDIENGFTVSMDLYVTENGGKNSGKSAYFIVTFAFSPN